MKTFGYIIIDSKLEGVTQLKNIADEVKEMEFLGVADNSSKALDLVLQYRPELIFLSLNFQDKKNPLSLEFIDTLYKYLVTIPKIIVVSDTKEWAYEAINYQVSGYLLRPFARSEFNKLVSTLLKSHQKNDIARLANKMQNADGLAETSNKKIKNDDSLLLCVKSYGDYRYIKANEVVYFKADNNSTDIYLHSGEMITAFKTLKHFEVILKEPFYRIHNSYLINSDFLSRIHLGSRSCILRNTSKKVPFSKSYRVNIDSIITDFSNKNCIEV